MVTETREASTAAPSLLSGIVSVLYAFAGEERRSDIEECMRDLSVQRHFHLDFRAVDILRSQGHDLLDEDFRNSLLDQASMGNCGVIICIPAVQHLLPVDMEQQLRPADPRILGLRLPASPWTLGAFFFYSAED